VSYTPDKQECRERIWESSRFLLGLAREWNKQALYQTALMLSNSPGRDSSRALRMFVANEFCVGSANHFCTRQHDRTKTGPRASGFRRLVNRKLAES